MRTTTIIAALAAALAMPAFAQPISYQGRITDSGAAPVGSYEVRFEVYGAASGGAAVGSTVTRSVSLDAADNGVVAFSDLDFGAGVFTGPARWLEVAVRASGDPTFTVLSPRQAIVSTPYAIYAAASATSLNAAYANGRIISNAGQNPVNITGNLDVGSPTSNGYFRLFMNGTATHVVQFGSIPGQGGQTRWLDEGGTTIGLLEADPQGTGMAMRLIGDGGNFDWDGDLGSGAASGSRLTITGPGSAWTFDTTLTGDAAFVVPPSSISAAEIADEAGVASVIKETGTALTSSIAPITSRSITVPGPGYVVALANCNIGVQRTSNQVGLLTIGVSSQPNVFPDSQQIVLQMPPSTLTFGQYNFPGAAHGVFEVTAGGTYTYYFNGRSTGFGTPQTFDATLTLIWIPTSYGTVAPTLYAPDGGYAVDSDATPTMSDREIMAERLAEQQRALAELRVEQAAMKAELEAIRARQSKE